MSKEFIVAARHRDGSKNLYAISDVDSYVEAQDFVRAIPSARTVLVCIPGGKTLKEAPIPEDQDMQEQIA